MKVNQEMNLSRSLFPVHRRSQNCAYLSNLVKTPFDELGWTGNGNDSMDTLKLRTIITKKMCVYGTASAHAGELLLSWKVDQLDFKFFFKSLR